MRQQLNTRYVFEGTLLFETGLHLGSGHGGASITDSPVLRQADGIPLIPGSSIKGAFRSAVERIITAIGTVVHTCGSIKGAKGCLSVDEEMQKALEKMKEDLKNQGASVRQTEEQVYKAVTDGLCNTCNLFGSSYISSKVFFSDMPVKNWVEVTEIRNGVGIDRDSEIKVEQVLFDYEVVPSQTTFFFSLLAENLSPGELGLISIGLRELQEGMIPLGGIRSRGLGRCRLEDLTINRLNFQEPDELQEYLLKRKMKKIDVETFLDKYLKELLKGESKDAKGTI